VNGAGGPERALSPENSYYHLVQSKTSFCFLQSLIEIGNPRIKTFRIIRNWAGTFADHGALTHGPEFQGIADRYSQLAFTKDDAAYKCGLSLNGKKPTTIGIWSKNSLYVEKPGYK
jgi:hypothetical protein